MNKFRKKVLFLFALTLIISICCVVIGCQNESLNKANSNTVHATINSSSQSSTEPTESLPPDFSDKANATVEVGSSYIIQVSDNEDKYITSWTSSNESVAVVDDGGKVDALNLGNATITVSYKDGKSSKCEISVVEATDNNDDIYSTCITANSDILAENLMSNMQNPYEIYVNRQMNTVTVYTYDENGDYTIPVRAMVASCGLNDGTITGEFGIYFKNEWNALYQNVYGHYVSGISGDYLFHSVPYLQADASTLETEEFNKLGEFASLGCVRLAAGDTKWIFENCVENTYVKIYDDDNPGPLGKPDTIKISDHSCGWDPTDNDPECPYVNKTPVISGANDITIKKGESLDLTKGISAIDTCSNDITDKMEIIGNVVISRVGTYSVTYSVKDALHRTDVVDITVTVTD